MRKEGWYWVKHAHGQAPWEAGLWEGGHWVLVGSDRAFTEGEVPVVGPRIQEPEDA